jgi:hypothetical protein
MVNKVLTCRDGKEHSLCGIRTDNNRRRRLVASASMSALQAGDGFCARTDVLPIALAAVSTMACRIAHVNAFAEFLLGDADFSYVMDIGCYLDRVGAAAAAIAVNGTAYAVNVPFVQECALGAANSTALAVHRQRIAQYLERRANFMADDATGNGPNRSALLALLAPMVAAINASAGGAANQSSVLGALATAAKTAAGERIVPSDDQTASPGASAAAGTSAGVIVAIVFGTLAAIAVLVLVVLIIQRRRFRATQYSPSVTSVL